MYPTVYYCVQHSYVFVVPYDDFMNGVTENGEYYYDDDDDDRGGGEICTVYSIQEETFRLGGKSRSPTTYCTRINGECQVYNLCEYYYSIECVGSQRGKSQWSCTMY